MKLLEKPLFNRVYPNDTKKSSVQTGIEQNHSVHGLGENFLSLLWHHISATKRGGGPWAPHFEASRNVEKYLSGLTRSAQTSCLFEPRRYSDATLLSVADFVSLSSQTKSDLSTKIEENRNLLARSEPNFRLCPMIFDLEPYGVKDVKFL